MAKNTRIVPISIEPKRLERLNRLAKWLGLTRSGFLARLIDNEWERYSLTDEGRKALADAQESDK